MQEVCTILIIRHGKAIHQHDDIYLRDVIIPFPALAFGGLVGYELATVIEHTAFEVHQRSPLYLDDKFFAVISRTGQIEYNRSQLFRFADMFIFIIDQILYCLSTPKQVIQKCNQQILIHFRAEYSQ